MNTFTLNERLAADTYPIVDTDDFYLGLNKNALIPWLILVPKTSEVELFRCSDDFKQKIRATVDSLALFCQSHFDADKMNIATLGNVVEQLHVHIIARKTDDCAWPDPVWGNTKFAAYTDDDACSVINAVRLHLNESSVDWGYAL